MKPKAIFSMSRKVKVKSAAERFASQCRTMIAGGSYNVLDDFPEEDGDKAGDCPWCGNPIVVRDLGEYEGEEHTIGVIHDYPLCREIRRHTAGEIVKCMADLNERKLS